MKIPYPKPTTRTWAAELAGEMFHLACFRHSPTGLELERSWSNPTSQVSEIAEALGLEESGLVMAVAGPIVCLDRLDPMAADPSMASIEWAGPDRLPGVEGIASGTFMLDDLPYILRYREDIEERSLSLLPPGLGTVLDAYASVQAMSMLIEPPEDGSIIGRIVDNVLWLFLYPDGALHSCACIAADRESLDRIRTRYWPSRMGDRPLHSFFAWDNATATRLSVLLEDGLFSGLVRIRKEYADFPESMRIPAIIAQAPDGLVRIAGQREAIAIRHAGWRRKTFATIQIGSIVFAASLALSLFILSASSILRLWHGKEWNRWESMTESVQQADSLDRLLKEGRGGIQEILSKRSETSDLISGIRSAIPDSAWLTSWSLADGGTMVLEGDAVRDASVTEFLSGLEKVRRISGARLRSTERTGRKSGTAVRFVIEAKAEP